MWSLSLTMYLGPYEYSIRRYLLKYARGLSVSWLARSINNIECTLEKSHCIRCKY